MCDARLSWWFNGFFQSSGETAAEDGAEVWELCEEFFQNLRQESKCPSVVDRLLIHLLIADGLESPGSAARETALCSRIISITLTFHL